MRLDSDSKIAAMEIPKPLDLGIVDEVAKYFINHAMKVYDCEGLSNKKLQKLVYYAQGFHLALFDKPLFEDKIYAWNSGSVCPNLYYKFKDYGNKPISLSNYTKSKLLSDKQCELLDEVWYVYGQFSTWKLKGMNKDEKIWGDHENDVSEITQQEMKQFFKERVNE